MGLERIFPGATVKILASGNIKAPKGIVYKNLLSIIEAEELPLHNKTFEGAIAGSVPGGTDSYMISTGVTTEEEKVAYHLTYCQKV